MQAFDLDVASPDQVPAVLERAADAYRESAGELASAWQDPSAGGEWLKIAKILDRARRDIEKALAASRR